MHISRLKHKQTITTKQFLTLKGIGGESVLTESCDEASLTKMIDDKLYYEYHYVKARHSFTKQVKSVKVRKQYVKWLKENSLPNTLWWFGYRYSFIHDSFTRQDSETNIWHVLIFEMK